MNEPVPAPVAVEEHLPRLNEWAVSMIRTVIGPNVAALVITVLAAQAGWDLADYSAVVEVAVFVLIAAAWYAAFRYIELAAKHPAVVKIAGALLGWWKQPASRAKPVT